MQLYLKLYIPTQVQVCIFVCLFYGFGLPNQTWLGKQTMQMSGWLVKRVISISENPVAYVINLTWVEKYLRFTEFYFILRYTRIEIHTFTCTIKYTKPLPPKYWREGSGEEKMSKLSPSFWFEQLSIQWYHLLRKGEQILELKVLNSALGEKLKNISLGEYKSELEIQICKSLRYRKGNKAMRIDDLN